MSHSFLFVSFFKEKCLTKCIFSFLKEGSIIMSSAFGVKYKCVKCGSEVSASQLELTPEVKCPVCGFRVLRKVRPPIVKKVKAR
jgi:DNA-directed RNA polymerase subunit P